MEFKLIAKESCMCSYSDGASNNCRVINWWDVVEYPSLITDLIIEHEGKQYLSPFVLEPTFRLRRVIPMKHESRLCMFAWKDGYTKISELSIYCLPGCNPFVISEYCFSDEWEYSWMGMDVDDSIDVDEDELLEKKFMRHLRMKLLGKVGYYSLLLCNATNRMVIARECKYVKTNIALTRSLLNSIKEVFCVNETLIIDSVSFGQIKVETGVYRDEFQIKILPTLLVERHKCKKSL